MVKLGGLGMDIGPFVDHMKRHAPPSSREIADAWGPWIKACSEAFGTGRDDIGSNRLGPAFHAVGENVLCQQCQSVGIAFGKGRDKARPVGQRHQSGGADAGTKIQQGPLLGPCRCPQQHRIEPGPEATPGLCQQQPAADKRIVRWRLVFYIDGGVV